MSKLKRAAIKYAHLRGWTGQSRQSVHFYVAYMDTRWLCRQEYRRRRGLRPIPSPYARKFKQQSDAMKRCRPPLGI